MTNINDKTSQLVSAAIARSKKSQVEISEQTTIARSSLQRKLSGLSKFTIDEIYAIAQALGLKAKDLLPPEILGQEQSKKAA